MGRPTVVHLITFWPALDDSLDAEALTGCGVWIQKTEKHRYTRRNLAKVTCKRHGCKPK